MKNVVNILVILLGTLQGYAQEFLITPKYTIKEDVPDKGQDYRPYKVHLVAAQEPSKQLATFAINDPELLETIHVTSLHNPGLEGLEEILKVEIEYLGCCAHVASHYFLIKDHQDIIPLPTLNNVYCPTSNTEQQYTFPNQAYGVVNSILKTEHIYNDMGEIQYVKLKHSYAWNDNGFETDRIAAY